MIVRTFLIRQKIRHKFEKEFKQFVTKNTSKHSSLHGIELCQQFFCQSTWSCSSTKKKLLSVHIIIIGLLNSIVNDDTFDPLILNMVQRIELNEDVTVFFATKIFREFKVVKNQHFWQIQRPWISIFGEFVQYFKTEFFQNQHSMLSNASNW